MTQETLFDYATADGSGSCPGTETRDSLSRVRDGRRLRHLVALAERVQQAVDPIERARRAAEVRDLAETLVEASIRDANDSGVTWRAIGASLGVPFQTLYRRYGTGAER